LPVVVTSGGGESSVEYSDAFSYYQERIYDMLNETQNIKVGLTTDVYGGAAYEFIYERDTAKFCSLINQNITYQATWLEALKEPEHSTFFTDQCFFIDNQEFQYGQKQSVFNFLYKLETLQIQFDENRDKFHKLNEILNSPDLVSFQTQLDVYYRSSFDMMLAKALQSINHYHSKQRMILLIEYSMFLSVTVLIFSILWRLFINDIKNEVYRSKGMLNMIPTNFL